MRGVRWFRAYRTYGPAPVAVEKVARFVQRHRLGDVVVSLRVERRAGREFWLFLTLETEQWGELPEELEDILGECPVLSQPLPEAFSLQDIQGMASGDLQVRALGQCLEYRQVRRESFENPFEVDARVLARDAELPEDAAERLLWFLSAAGTGSWSSLRAACRALGVTDAGLASRLARHLRLLGHLELLDRGRWAVPPAAVACVQVDGRPVRFLVGARDSRSLTLGSVDRQAGGPGRVVVPQGVGAEELVWPADALSLSLPGVAAYRAGLGTLGSVNPQLLKLRLFDGQRFAEAAFSGQVGLFELTLPDGRTQHALHVDGRWVEGEFFTLRFLAVQAMGLLEAWRFRADREELAVRFEGRLPEVYERALVLCSGLLPESRGGWLVYRNVPLRVAARLAAKLDVALDLTAPEVHA